MVVAPKPDKANTRLHFFKILCKEIDAYHGLQLSVNDVLGGLHEASKCWGRFSKAQSF